eukprot:CAMPEP_0201533562 /NCGR_PEP_ID=MMETSP0161_2-20130828/53595_1 /ASSEMBLY_ACC=CAM_ASM_000251 /TAXON_ID=180227 /ORGANISM="Neoparamoeba aestuarina, Strain SoJaBio B1-5/56/2" /LENGTH=546 /DNA_ID=CAMNT_0047937657 /DNA_START=22 /DNA_END=1659 /DNA_ORIENTATION=+
MGRFVWVALFLFVSLSVCQQKHYVYYSTFPIGLDPTNGKIEMLSLFEDRDFPVMKQIGTNGIMVSWASNSRRQLSHQSLQLAHEEGFNVVAAFSFEGYIINDETFTTVSKQITEDFTIFLTLFQDNWLAGDTICLGTVFDPLPGIYTKPDMMHLWTNLYATLLVIARDNLPDGVDVAIFVNAEAIWTSSIGSFASLSVDYFILSFMGIPCEEMTKVTDRFQTLFGDETSYTPLIGYSSFDPTQQYSQQENFLELADCEINFDNVMIFEWTDQWWRSTFAVTPCGSSLRHVPCGYYPELSLDAVASHFPFVAVEYMGITSQVDSLVSYCIGPHQETLKFLQQVWLPGDTGEFVVPSRVCADYEFPMRLPDSSNWASWIVIVSVFFLYFVFSVYATRENPVVRNLEEQQQDGDKEKKVDNKQGGDDNKGGEVAPNDEKDIKKNDRPVPLDTDTMDNMMKDLFRHALLCASGKQYPIHENYFCPQPQDDNVKASFQLYFEVQEGLEAGHSLTFYLTTMALEIISLHQARLCCSEFDKAELKDNDKKLFY